MVDAVIAGSAIIVTIAVVIYVVLVLRIGQRTPKKNTIPSGGEPYVEDDPALPVSYFWVGGTRYRKQGYRDEVIRPEKNEYIVSIPYTDGLGNVFWAQNVDLNKNVYIDPRQAIRGQNIHAHLKTEGDMSATEKALEERDNQLYLKTRESQMRLEELEKGKLGDRQKRAIDVAANAAADTNASVVRPAPSKRDKDKDKRRKDDEDKEYQEEEDEEGSEYE